MFRRLESSLPEDPVFPTSLEELGYFINDRDQIRYKKKPELEFIYRINKNNWINEKQREAMNQCIRDILKSRFEKLGLITVRLPLSAPPSEPHVPILVSPNTVNKSRIICYFGESGQDLGVLAYRTVGRHSIHKGSVEDFVNGILTGTANSVDAEETPGILIANPGQLLWYRGGQKALTLHSWSALPRKTAVHDSMRIDPVKNHAQENENVDSHVAYIFEKVLASMASPSTQLDIIAMEWTSVAVVRYLNHNWSKISSKVSTIVFGAPQFTLQDTLDPAGEPRDFADFLSRRARAYLLSNEDIDTPVPGRDSFGCNCYSSGENVYSECVMEQSWHSMLSWIGMAHSVNGFSEIAMDIPTNNNDRGELRIARGDRWPVGGEDEDNAT